MLLGSWIDEKMLCLAEVGLTKTTLLRLNGSFIG